MWLLICSKNEEINMYNTEANKAKFHFYFSTEILSLMNKNKLNSGDLFGYGEDCFIVDLYEYSSLLFDAFTSTALLDSSLFEVCKFLAIEFFGAVLDSGELTMECKFPEVNKFKKTINNVLTAFINR